MPILKIVSTPPLKRSNAENLPSQNAGEYNNNTTGITQADLEIDHILDILRNVRFQKAETKRILGINGVRLYRKVGLTEVPLVPLDTLPAT